MFAISRGIVEVETETRDVLERTQTKRKSKSLQLLVEQCHDLQEQLYTQVFCHRCRDIWEATRVLTLVSLGGVCEGVTMKGEIVKSSKTYCIDDYIKYFGLSLGDSEKTVRLEAIRQIISL